MDLSIEVRTQDSVCTLVVRGEVDVSNANELRDTLNKALETTPAPHEVVVNLADVDYIDSTGIGVLVGGAHRAQEMSCDFAVTNPQANVHRVLGLLGVEKELNLAE